MKYSDVNIKSLKTVEECDTAIELIENDYKNIHGGFDAYNSGYEVSMLKGADKKIEAIQAKSDTIFNKDFPEFVNEEY